VNVGAAVRIGMALTGRLGVLSNHPFFGMVGYPVIPQRFSRSPRVSIDERPVALPKLYGAPAYARPPIKVQPTPRPFDPDQLPIQAHQTEDERQYAARLPAHAYGSTEGQGAEPDANAARPFGLRPRLLNLRSIAGRLLGND
jgi:hypothetical protein